jgi:energy-coupling factor transport system permease protein
MQSLLDFRLRGTIIESFDPRARLIFFVCYTTALVAIRNLYVLIPLACLPVGLFFAARLTFQETKQLWRSNLTLIVLITLVAIFVGRSWLDIGLQLIRFFGLATCTFTFFLTVNPADYGIMFKQLGAGDKLSFALNLMMRFVPTLTRDLTVTIDAQRARGYEMDNVKGGFVRSLGRVVPIMLPVVVRSVIDSEAMANAMELRAFGTQPRTWLRLLTYNTRDYFLIAFSISLVLLVVVLVWGIGQ